jgi:hypothetical protein
VDLIIGVGSGFKVQGAGFLEVQGAGFLEVQGSLKV